MLFLVTPFYAIRLTFNAAYDFFLVFYLLSYVLMNSTSRSLRWLAPISLLFSLSLETLLALEPLRLLFVSYPGQSWRGWFTRLIPFGLTVVLVVVLRVGRAEFRPPCRRTAVQALLWLLALPVSSCENIGSGG